MLTQIAQITQISCPPLISQIFPITLGHWECFDIVKNLHWECFDIVKNLHWECFGIEENLRNRRVGRKSAESKGGQEICEIREICVRI